MKFAREFLANTLVGGLLIVLPIVPIQPLFGVVGAGLSVIALLAVGLGGRASDTASVRAE